MATSIAVWMRLAAACVFVALSVLLAYSIVNGAWDAGQAPFPFVWRDVAVVNLLCAIPLAAVLTRAIRRIVPPGLLVAAAAIAFAISVLLCGDIIHFHMSVQVNILLRAGVSLGVMLSICLSGIVVFASHGSADVGRPFGFTGAAGALIVLVVLPLFYVAARCRHDARRLEELVDQRRIAEARALAINLMKLDDNIQTNDKSLRNLVADLTRATHHLEDGVASPLPAHATSDERLERAQQLAMLGRTDQALDALNPVNDPNADILRGVTYEARGDWEAGLASYERARLGLENQLPSDERLAGMTRALSGTAYCQRKAGRYDQAEVAYLKLLELAPTADTHFLLAQFYDDAQQAQKAHHHARRAITFAPARYRDRGEKLIRRLSVFQFGCFRVFDADRAFR